MPVFWLLKPMKTVGVAATAAIWFPTIALLTLALSCGTRAGVGQADHDLGSSRDGRGYVVIRDRDDEASPVVVGDGIRR